MIRELVDDCEILSREQLEDGGGCNDNPNTVLRVRLTDGREGWVAGPHGVDCCAISDWLEFVGELAATRAEAICDGTSERITD